MTKEKSVLDLRDNIDGLDRQIHDLLMQRAELVQMIGKQKKKNGEKIILPNREASKIRTLLERHEGHFSETALVRIWREIISAASMLQMDMKVIIVAPSPEMNQTYHDMARYYFGSVMPMQMVSNPVSAISMVKEGDASFAILPWPEDEVENPWWSWLHGDDPAKNLNVLVRLPYVSTEANGLRPDHRALVVGKQSFEGSGHDHSFVMLDLDQSVSRARILDCVKAMDMSVHSIFSRRLRGVGHERSLHMIEIDSFLDQDDSRLDDLLKKLENQEGAYTVIGGYPVMPLMQVHQTQKRKTA